MGIQGLLPLLKSIHQPIQIAELKGQTVGVDAYCWLHKGVYGCAMQLAEGKQSNVYINYVMKRVNMMLYFDIKPIMVFDGGYLPSKSEKEADRRNKRKENKAQGLAYLQKGNRTKALECFQKSIDISPEMAHNVIKACRAQGVECIVAPYEADAQLAFLMKKGITQVTISEDSDLLVYGCDKVVFKMDANGAGVLINLNNLANLKGLRMEGFTEQKFREMCILSGCDYLPSVKGMGLVTAHKLLRKHSSVNKLISTLRLNNKMSVPKDYEEKFTEAEQTFLYQIVFDPTTNKLVPLNDIPDNLTSEQLHFAGHNGKWQDEDAIQIALGNLDPITGKTLGDIMVDETSNKVISTRDIEVTKDDQNTKGKQHHTKKSSSWLNTNHPVMASATEYEATKNLNGSFKKTKSSERTSRQFVTPMKDEHLDTATLAKLYCDTKVDSKSLETLPEDMIADKEQTSVVEEKVKKRLRNPFRSPITAKRRASDEVVQSRYFGLTGIEKKEEQRFNAEIKNISPEKTPNIASNKINHDNQQSPTSNHKPVSPMTIDQTTNPSTDNLPSKTGVTTPQSSKTHHFLSETKWAGKRGWNLENKAPPKKKIRSSQTSLDKFAFVKNSLRVSVNKVDEMASRMNHQVLGNMDDNCENIEDLSGMRVINAGEVEEYTRVLDVDKEPRKLIALDSKHSNGISKCRSVGLTKSRGKAESKKTSMPLMSYFAYQGRSSQLVKS